MGPGADAEPARAPLPHAVACPSCAAPHDDDDRFCGYCGTALAAPRVAPAAPARHFRCANCAAEIAALEDQRSYVCPFCDAAHVTEMPPEHTGRQQPEFVIGFAVPPERALDIYRGWIRDNGWLRPGDLRGAAIEDKLRGIYIPFWSFSTYAHSRWSASIGEYWYRTETYTTRDAQGKTVTRTRRVRETEWWPLSGHHHDFHSHYLVSGSRGLGQSAADAVKPFHLEALHRYEPGFLAGWLAEEYSVDRDTAMKVSMQEFHRREQQAVAAFLPGDTHRNLQVTTEFARTSSDLVLLPLYVASYRYRGRLFRFLINGQTGVIAGDKPWSGWRIALLVIAVIAVIAAIAVAVTQR